MPPIHAPAQGEAEKAEEFLWGEGLLQGDEWLRMVPYDTNRYGTVYFWMATMAVRARRQGALEPEQFLRLDQTIAKAREVCLIFCHGKGCTYTTQGGAAGGRQDDVLG